MINIYPGLNIALGAVNIVQPCHKSGFVNRLRSAKIYCGLSGTGSGFFLCALAFYGLYKAANAPYSILYHPGVKGLASKL